MMRSSVVLPEPDGPSSATSEPCGTSRLTLSTATKSPNRLVMLRTEIPTPAPSSRRGVAPVASLALSRCTSRNCDDRGAGAASASPAASRTRAVRSRRVFHSSAVFTASVTSASDDSSDAAANAADMLYSWKSFSTRSGRVSV